MSPYVRPTLYYEEHPTSPDATVKAALERAKDLNLHYFVTASASGSTALRASELVAESGLSIQIVCVANPIGWTGPKINVMKPETREKLEAKGVKIVQGSRPLNGLDMAFQKKYGGVTLGTTILEAYLRFSEGMFHAIQVAVMAADAGFVPTDEDIIAEALYDTALVLRPANLRNFFDLNIREIICMAIYPPTKMSWE